MSADRIDKQVAFLTEVDRLKSIERATTLGDGTRFENSAEHSWHVALYALILAEQARPDVEISRVIKMLLIHDLVEIDAGDAPIFGQYDAEKLADEEAKAARRIFGLLPADQASELLDLWNEFEAATTPDAQFAKSMDRFQPPNQNLASGGGSWKDYGVDLNRIEARVGAKIARGAPGLWAWLKPKIKRFMAEN
ncbi:MAG: hydrolase [Marinovum sp.]|jgi:putative hydrolase of HD superfamily|nr:hydrolase [Marinovum sp.]